jgi:hypothetical protein
MATCRHVTHDSTVKKATRAGTRPRRDLSLESSHPSAAAARAHDIRYAAYDTHGVALRPVGGSNEKYK